jgi:hypothetical protein
MATKVYRGFAELGRRLRRSRGRHRASRPPAAPRDRRPDRGRKLPPPCSCRSDPGTHAGSRRNHAATATQTAWAVTEKREGRSPAQLITAPGNWEFHFRTSGKIQAALTYWRPLRSGWHPPPGADRSRGVRQCIGLRPSPCKDSIQNDDRGLVHRRLDYVVIVHGWGFKPGIWFDFDEVDSDWLASWKWLSWIPLRNPPWSSGEHPSN